MQDNHAKTLAELISCANSLLESFSPRHALGGVEDHVSELFSSQAGLETIMSSSVNILQANKEANVEFP